MNCLARLKASSAVPATSERKPISRDRSRRMAAKVSSSSMTSRTRFASDGASRSSSTLRGPCMGAARPCERATGQTGDAGSDRFARRDQRRVVGFGNGDREGAALALAALEVDRAAQQAHELARDRKAEAGAAVLAADRAVGLVKGLERRSAAVPRRCRCRYPSPTTRSAPRRLDGSTSRPAPPR